MPGRPGDEPAAPDMSARLPLITDHAAQAMTPLMQRAEVEGIGRPTGDAAAVQGDGVLVDCIQLPLFVDRRLSPQVAIDVYERRIKPRVDFNGPPPSDPWRPVEGGCWLWTGGKVPAGYGSTSVANETHMVHRIVYVALRGPIPEEMFVDHVCRVRACIRHLEVVTPAENQIRSQRDCCRRGHAMTAANTYRPAARPTQRVCRTCAAESCRRHRARRMARKEAA